MGDETTLPVRDSEDIARARQIARGLAGSLGFSVTDLTLIATAVSEIARNIVQHGGGGEMGFRVVDGGSARGLAVTAVDHGPGIPDLPRAMEKGYTTGNGLGLGLPGARRLMDDFRIESRLHGGTIVSMVKWLGP